MIDLWVSLLRVAPINHIPTSVCCRFFLCSFWLLACCGTLPAMSACPVGGPVGGCKGELNNSFPMKDVTIMNSIFYFTKVVLSVADFLLSQMMTLIAGQNATINTYWLETRVGFLFRIRWRKLYVNYYFVTTKIIHDLILLFQVIPTYKGLKFLSHFIYCSVILFVSLVVDFWLIKFHFIFSLVCYYSKAMLTSSIFYIASQWLCLPVSVGRHFVLLSAAVSQRNDVLHHLKGFWLLKSKKV